MSTRYKRTDWVRRLEDFSSGCSSGFRLLGQCLLASLLALFAGINRCLQPSVPMGANASVGDLRLSGNGAGALKSSVWRGLALFATVIITFVVTISSVVPTFAEEWKNDPTNITIAKEVTGFYEGTVVSEAISDGDGGGAITSFAFQDGTVSVQRVKADGTTWSEPTVIGNGRTAPALDLSGDTIFATWKTSNNNVVRVQRLHLDGSLLTSIDLSDDADKTNPIISSDGKGGVYIAWGHPTSTQPWEEGKFVIYLQHLNSLGSTLCKQNGTTLPNAVGQKQKLGAISGDSDGAYIAFISERHGVQTVDAMRVNENCEILWDIEPTGVQISTVLNEGFNSHKRDITISKTATQDIIVSWKQTNPDNYYAQRINTDGHKLWNNGYDNKIYTSHLIRNYKAISDGENGTLFAMCDHDNISVSRHDSNGIKLWSQTWKKYKGEDLCQEFDLVVHDNGDSVVMWMYDFGYQNYYFGTPIMSAMKISKQGDKLWPNYSTLVSIVPNSPITNSVAYPSQQNVSMVPSKFGNTIFVWRDDRDNHNAYTECLDENGQLCGFQLSEDTLSFCDSVTQIPQEECEALVIFYYNTRGYSWTAFHDDDIDWFSTNKPCEWERIECENIDENLHVTRLSLHSRNLIGSIPPEIGQLSQLKHLILGSYDNDTPNHLTGRIPSQIGELTELEWLDLYDNELCGEIPKSLANLTNIPDSDINYPGLELGGNHLNTLVDVNSDLYKFLNSKDPK
jgi:hypothetical protein